MNSRKQNILITGVGGPTPRSFTRALKLADDSQYRCFGTDIHSNAIGLYLKDLFEKGIITPKSNEDDYWKVMEDIIQRYSIDVAVILPESEVRTWSIRQHEDQLPCKALIPDFRCVDTMLDKSLLSNILAEVDLVAKNVSFDRGEPNLNELISTKLSLPFWVRSTTGSSGLGSLKVRSLDELERWININLKIERFIASEYLPGRNLACKMLYFDGNLIRAGVAERVNYIMAKIVPSGITGNTAMGRLINDKKAFEVAKEAMELIFERTGSRKHGFFTVDLKEDENGVPKVTEINIRHVAFTSAFALAGANFCVDTVNLLNGEPGFDFDFKMYNFKENYVFLREVDALPILLREEDLL